MMEIKDEIKDAQQLFEVKSNLVSNIMNNILLLSSMNKNSEAMRYQAQLSKLIQEGEVYDLNNLLRATEKTLDMYR
jgi:putative GTP pyrophosphokinase